MLWLATRGGCELPVDPGQTWAEIAEQLVRPMPCERPTLVLAEPPGMPRVRNVGWRQRKYGCEASASSIVADSPGVHPNTVLPRTATLAGELAGCGFETGAPDDALPIELELREGTVWDVRIPEGARGDPAWECVRSRAIQWTYSPGVTGTVRFDLGLQCTARGAKIP